MSTIGRMPTFAWPAAKATVCDSQMPVSKKRSGNSSRTFSSLFPWHIAAVSTVTLGFARIWSTNRLASDVRVGRRRAAFFAIDVLVLLALELRRGVERRPDLRRRAESRGPFR